MIAFFPFLNASEKMRGEGVAILTMWLISLKQDCFICCVVVICLLSLQDTLSALFSLIFALASVPIAAPSRVHGVPYNGTAIMVDWNPMDKSRKAIRGKIMGYQVHFDHLVLSFLAVCGWMIRTYTTEPIFYVKIS